MQDQQITIYVHVTCQNESQSGEYTLRVLIILLERGGGVARFLAYNDAVS